MKLLLKKKRSLFLIILCLVSISSYSQKVTFKEIKLRANPKISDTRDSTIIYPIVVTQNAAIANRINSELKKVIVDDFNIDDEDSSLGIKENLMKHTAEGLINLSYDVLYNRNYVLSLVITAEGCGAYCSTFYIYLNFDLATGHRLMITDVITPAKLAAFKRMVATDKKRFLNAYKKEQRDDAEIYESVRELVDSNCINTLDISKFAIKDTSIEIIDDCEFPHVIKALEPIYDLKYRLKKIEAYLNPKIRSRLLR